MLPALTGCAPNIVGDFSTAERLAVQHNKPLVVYYTSWLSAECGAMRAALDSSEVRRKLGDKVVCYLDESYEPNRRFVAQFGVERYPALIVVRPDGTFHSRVGRMAPGEIAAFIEQSRAPGQPAQVNPQLPRRIDYHWEGDYQRALQRAQAEGRRVFVFYKSVLSPESNDVLVNVLNRPEVAAEFHDTINCLLDWGHPPNRRFMARFGITDVPGFLLIAPDGTHHARQGRLNAEQMVSFIREARRTAGQPAPP